MKLRLYKIVTSHHSFVTSSFSPVVIQATFGWRQVKWSWRNVPVNTTDLLSFSYFPTRSEIYGRSAEAAYDAHIYVLVPLNLGQMHVHDMLKLAMIVSECNVVMSDVVYVFGKIQW